MKHPIFSKRRVANIAVVGFTLLLSSLAQAGSCNYVQENMFAGPFDVCAEPVDSARCTEFGEEGSNASAVYSEDACSADKVVGTCVVDDYSLIYYSGEADSLEVGCGFQGGDWK